MIRMALAARSRPDIDMENAISEHEFSLIPWALSAPDSTLLPCIDKSKLGHILKLLLNQPSDKPEKNDLHDKVLIIDAMLIIHELDGRKDIQSCSELSQAFIHRIDKLMKGYSAVHIIFDQYDKIPSLKQSAREPHQGSNTPVISCRHNAYKVVCKSIYQQYPNKRQLNSIYCAPNCKSFQINQLNCYCFQSRWCHNKYC